MMSQFSWGVGLCILLLVSCTKSNLEEVDLLAHGLPITLEAPVDADIQQEDFGVQKSIQIKGEDKYTMSIFQSDVYTPLDVSLEEVKRNVQDNIYFDSFVTEEPDGFIYKIVVDSSFVNYNFRHFKHLGDKEYMFQAGFIERFSLKEVERLYQIAKAAR